MPLVHHRSVCRGRGRCRLRFTQASSPSDPFAGVWLGTIADEGSGSGTLRFALTAQPGGGVVGTWAATFSNRESNNGGTVSATVALTPIQFALECTQSGERGVAIITMTANGKQMSGTYGGVTCNGLRRGTVELSQQ